MKVFIPILFLILPFAVIAQLPTSGLVAWYPFCGNANDYSGNGHNLIDSGAILTTDRFGSANCAYHFNGVNNELYLNYILSLPPSNFTIACWMIADTSEDAEVVYNGNTNSNGVGIINDNGALLSGYNVTMLEGYICDCITAYEPPHQWHHIVLRCSGGFFNLIVDTGLVGTTASPFNPPVGKFAIGLDYSNGTNPFLGKIDDVAIYNRALSDSEIRQLYHYDPDCATISPPSACDSISLPDTLHACSEVPVILPAILYGADSLYSIEWTSTTGMPVSPVLDPALSATISGWYHLTVQSIMPGNLVVNGDFSAGNTGFTSGYTYNPVAPPPGTASVPGDYDLATNAYLYNTAWPSMGDHTTGAGNMLIMDASGTSGVSFWCETIPVIPNTNYIFSVWSALLFSPAPSIQLTINGVSTDTFTTATTVAGWAQSHVTWYSGAATSATICMADLDTAAYGNDFAVDDIFFQQLCTAKDSVYIDVTAPGNSYGHKDTTICSSVTSVILNAPAGYSSYLWNTGAVTASVSAGSGIYWVKASISCASFTDTFYVAAVPVPIVNLGNDTSICEGDIITLGSVQPPGSKYLWSTGNTSSSIAVSAAGTYTLTVTQNGCSASSSVAVSELNKPTAIDLGPDTILCNGDQLILSVNNADRPLLWSTGSADQNITVTKAGNYWVAASNICGSVADTVNVNFELCDIWFPSAFTPNDDGLNDIIRVVGNLQRYKDFSLSIYNRWGQRVFYTEDIYSGWNGKFNGVAQGIGTYFYMMSYTLEGKKHLMKGDLELIR